MDKMDQTNFSEAGEDGAMTERRTHPRVGASHPVLYVSETYRRPRVGSTIDLSTGGTRIETPYTLAESERLEISIAIHPKVIRCRGHVVHVISLDGENLKAGIRFEDPATEHWLYLKQYISYVMEHRT